MYHLPGGEGSVLINPKPHSLTISFWIRAGSPQADFTPIAGQLDPVFLTYLRITYLVVRGGSTQANWIQSYLLFYFTDHFTGTWIQESRHLLSKHNLQPME